MRGLGRRGAVLALAAACLLLSAGPAAANGFPHFAISLEQLLALLASGDPQHRLGAATSLGIRREAAAVEPLLAVVERDPSESVRVEAVEALGAIRDARATARLVARLGSEPSPRVRTQIADVLGDLGGNLAQATLRRLVVDDPSPETRGRAALALGRLRAAGTRTLLEERLGSEWDDGVAARLLEALGRLGDPDATPAILGFFVGRREPAIRTAAALALGKLGDRRATPPLVAVLQDASSEPPIRHAAALALAGLRDPAAIPALAALLGEPDVVSVGLGIRALAETGREEAVAPLVRLGAEMRSEIVRLAGEASTGTFARHVEVLTTAIEVVRALGRLGDGRAWPLIEWALGARSGQVTSVMELRLRERRWELRRAAVLALAGMRDQARARTWFSRLLGDRDPSLRAEATRAIGLRAEPAGSGLLRRALRDRDPEVRWEAARALGGLQTPGVATLLLQALADSHPRVVAEAARALGRLGAVESTSRLEALARSRSDDEVREAAAEALSLLRPR